MPPSPQNPENLRHIASETEDDKALRSRLQALLAEGWSIWEEFSADAHDRPFHAFVAADYDVVCEALWPYRGRGLRFVEWGSATGVITVMADILGFDAYGIELDEALVETARELAGKFSSDASFASGSFVPTGYRWRPQHGDARIGTLGTGPSGYLQLGRALDEFDIIYAYPWDGEEPMMRDLVQAYGRADALLLLHSASDGVRTYRGGRKQ
jgi:hypothetical protein